MSRLAVAAGSVFGFGVGGVLGMALAQPKRPAFSTEKELERELHAGVIGALVGSTLFATLAAGSSSAPTQQLASGVGSPFGETCSLGGAPVRFP